MALEVTCVSSLLYIHARAKKNKFDPFVSESWHHLMLSDEDELEEDVES